MTSNQSVLIYNPCSYVGLRGNLRHNEPLSEHTSWRVGGPAQWFYEPADVLDLAHFMQQLPDDIPVFWLGLGSNLLVRDGGIPGVVILTAGLLNEIKLLDDNTLRVEAGVSCAKLARFVARARCFGGTEFLAGIPGTFGGALAMNAGAWGKETWSFVQEVETLNRQGQPRSRQVTDYEIGYRRVKGPENEWFVAATLQLSPTSEEGKAKIQALLKERNEKQPIGLPSCGSVFRNPPGDYAARLIEQAGWKGRCEGGACVSEKHANFIINCNNALAADIESLIEQIKASIEQKYSISLIPEVRIVGVDI
ncbi:MAG: UDP-N-acetylenolpyruvoylglucosamine reductase [Candidatus Parabeggiatoa sp. nov. 3]|nr:MAG: UDP-N-acetylenolpyruvoylglucosamine reductase [Gammaproteobacteria bacterium]RKZ64658.1 MAG: UDP-N-acetylenolpyruvoylglucosamine reductase [Gammaproteobacteria bacterium]RKZ89450.1 MAG: UDP-N-acetylenolpyruvoylglucosamine reductase [Gammaproteobacteria bacterium]